MDRRVAYVSIRHDRTAAELSVSILDPEAKWSGGPEPFSITREKLDKEIAEFWKFVNARISEVTSEHDAAVVQDFYDELVPSAINLTDNILSHDMSAALQSAASEVEELVLMTDLLSVPWEALYSGDSDNGRFLSDKCTILRLPHHIGGASRDPRPPRPPMTRRERAFFIDPDINERMRVSFEGRPYVLAQSDGTSDRNLFDFLAEQYTNDVILTGRKKEFSVHIKDTKLVHWLCHHAKEGLRLKNGVFYGQRDAKAYRFLEGGVVFLTACSAGASSFDEFGLAAQIALHSNCTVIAPSSIIEASAGFAFLIYIARALEALPKPISISEFWRTMLGHNRGENVSLLGCLSLFFGVYGSGNQVLKGVRDGD